MGGNGIKQFLKETFMGDTTFRLLYLPMIIKVRFFLSCRVDLKRMPVPGLTQWLDVTLRKKVIESSLGS